MIHSYSISLRHQLRDTAVQVIELAPPLVATDLTPGQRDNPRAMPLEDFIRESMALLAADPEAAEILVERVKALRTASGRWPLRNRVRSHQSALTLERHDPVEDAGLRPSLIGRFPAMSNGSFRPNAARRQCAARGRFGRSECFTESVYCAAAKRSSLPSPSVTFVHPS